MTMEQSLQASEFYKNCPLCSGVDLRNLYVVNGFTIARCENCEYVFTRQKLTDVQLEAFYASQGTDYTYDDPRNLANLNYYFNRIRAVIEGIVPQGKLLDVGCNAGQFMKVMKDFWDGYGIELSPHFAAQAKAQYGARVHQGTLGDCKYANSFFDVITMMDMLDHTPDPVRELSLANRYLRTGGLIVVKVHNISCLWARLSKGNFYAICPPVHLCYFNKHSLGFALEKAGFKVIDNMFIGNRILLKTIPYRLARGNTGSSLYKVYKWLDRIPLGHVPINKNFFDIITVLAVKEKEPVLLRDGSYSDSCK